MERPIHPADVRVHPQEDRHDIFTEIYRRNVRHSPAPRRRRWLRHHGRAPKVREILLSRLLANAIATGVVLVTVILAFGSISGAHLNPVVTLSNAYQGEIRWKEVLDTCSLSSWAHLEVYLLRTSCLVKPFFPDPSTREREATSF